MTGLGQEARWDLFFSPPGENERFIKQCGSNLLEGRDTTESAATVSKRWHDADTRKKSALLVIESGATFKGLQESLSCVHPITPEIIDTQRALGSARFQLAVGSCGCS